MNSPDPILRFADALANTLLHSLWQGSLITLILAGCFLMTGKANTGLRYSLACVAFFALPLWIAATFASEWRESDSGSLALEIRSAGTFPLSIDRDRPAASSGYFQAASEAINWRFPAALTWGAGATLFLLRLVAGWLRLRRLQQSAVRVSEPEYLRHLAEASGRLGISLRVRLLASDRIASPIMTGFLWPAIILPTGMLGGVPPCHLQSILTHELAHFRRWDYVVNLCQCLVEAILFYHPAVWWISRQIRIEREFACDDLAAALLGGERHYAGTLAWLESYRTQPQSLEPALGIIRDGRETLARIERLTSAARTRALPGHSSGLLGLLLAASGLLIATAPTEIAGKPTGPIPSDLRVTPPTAFERCETGRLRAEKSIRFLKEKTLWRPRIYRDYEAPLFKSVIILERRGKLYNLHHEEPRLFPEFPNHYLLEQELNILDGDLPLRDPDRDGFTNLEEFRAGTWPKDAESHPDYANKLKFVSRQAQIYRITFAAQPDESRIQLNRLPSAKWNRKTMIHRIGEISQDGQLRLEKLTEEGLVVTFLGSGESCLLPKRQPIEIPTWFAELRLDLDGEAPFFVKLGDTFRLDREPDRILRLTAAEKTGARIRGVEADESRVIGILNTPDRRE